MINFEELEDRIKNCSSDKELLIIEDEIFELGKKHPDVAENLILLIENRRKNLQEHACDPWRMKKLKEL
jgi:hypothetical protein